MLNLELKVPPVIVVVVVGIVMWLISLVSPSIPIAGSVKSIAVSLALMLGGVFSVFGVLSFKKVKTTVNPLTPDQSSSLVTSGIYKFTRNPMYVGFLLILIAWASYLLNVYSLMTSLLFVVYMNKFQIAPEEKALRSMFGEEFERYAKKARRWL